MRERERVREREGRGLPERSQTLERPIERVRADADADADVVAADPKSVERIPSWWEKVYL